MARRMRIATNMSARTLANTASTPGSPNLRIQPETWRIKARMVLLSRPSFVRVSRNWQTCALNSLSRCRWVRRCCCIASIRRASSSSPYSATIKRLIRELNFLVIRWQSPISRSQVWAYLAERMPSQRLNAAAARRPATTQIRWR